MKNRALLTAAVSLAAVMLFFVMLSGGRETLRQRDALLASAQLPAPETSDIVRAVNDEIMNPDTPLALQYTRYPTTFVYFVVGEASAPIYSSPNSDRHIVRAAENREKLNYLETVAIQRGEASGESAGGENREGMPHKTEIWYHIFWYENEIGEFLPDGSDPRAQKRFGFIPDGSAWKRRIRIDAMADCVEKADAFISGATISHISNYKNGNGRPPQYRGADTDAMGNARSQSAPGYPEPVRGDEFTYLPDGSIVKVLDPLAAGSAGGADSYRRVQCLSDEKLYYVPLKYIPQQQTLTELKKAVVIDRANQNEAAFEKIEGVWTCISCTMATTGDTGGYAAPTPLGYFSMIEKRPQFYYYKDGTTQIQGYAPYVLRFCGGAYIHGVPVSYQYKDGKRITPPIKEFSPTMGTVPLSHKCVRNYTSHAEFLYQWYEEGRTAVIVME